MNDSYQCSPYTGNKGSKLVPSTYSVKKELTEEYYGKLALVLRIFRFVMAEGKSNLSVSLLYYTSRSTHVFMLGLYMYCRYESY